MKEKLNSIRYFLFTLFILVLILTFINIFVSDKEVNNYYEEEKETDTRFVFDTKEISTSKLRIRLPNHNQTDLELVKDLFSKLIPPAPKTVPYYLRTYEFETSQGQGRVVRKLTNYKEGGFFVECGAGNGEFFSNTLFLEKNLGWTGLLIEADSSHNEDLRQVNRKAWIAEACMSLNTSAYESYFKQSSRFYGKVVHTYEPNSVKVTCYPFFTFLLALNVTFIDYFSLDVEGDEIEIIETIPFDKINITVLSVEFSKSRGGMLGLKNIMERKGYKAVDEVSPDDLIFMKKTAMNK